LTADEFFALPDNGERSELVDGVVVVSPSPMPRHNHVAGEVYRQLANFLEEHPIGVALMETDAHIGRGLTGGDLVYRSEVIFVERKNLPKDPNRDYEKAGVHEYWVIDAERRSMRFFRLRRGKYAEVRPSARRYQSQAVPGFSLNLTKVRAAFTPW
jgi:Uma2 family endonuclease